MRGRGVEYGDDEVVWEEGGASADGAAFGAEVLLAVDLGLRCGLAWWARGVNGADGAVRLVRHRCTEFHTKARLKAALPGVLAEVAGVVAVVGEGDRGLWAYWEKVSAARGVEAVWVSPETWRVGLWGAGAPVEGVAAKARARVVADGGPGVEGLVAQFGGRRATRLRTDAAEAVCIGYWAARVRGWVAESGREGAV